jgi:hypothetical protein
MVFNAYFIHVIFFSISLPDVPFEPKFRRYPFNNDYLSFYQTTSLEKNYNYQLHPEPDLGVKIDLIDPLKYNGQYLMFLLLLCFECVVRSWRSLSFGFVQPPRIHLLYPRKMQNFSPMLVVTVDHESL